MRTGLRTEIILSISLLLAAALLFAGFLLVKLTENNLLEQQRSHAASVMRLLAAGAVGDQDTPPGMQPLDLAVTTLQRLQAVLARQPDILAWRLLDARLQVLSSTTYQPTYEFATLSPLSMEQGELYEQLEYQSYRLFRSGAESSFLDLSTPLLHDGEPFALLQVRFSLEALHQRVVQSQKLILFYVVAYGLILAVFALYLLNRNVVRPVRELHRATATVATGSLTSVKVPSGPGEIHELADSFNRMVTALSASRHETEQHIDSLEEANHQLQQARDELVRSEKLATVGHLAAGMAHEIGNPLGAVIGYLNILRSDLSGEALDLVERSLVETGRIDRLVRELLEYSAPVERVTESFCPVALLRETIDMLQHQGQLDNIEIVDNCNDGECLVEMDRSQLMQVWINLLLNARDAMQDAGRLVFNAGYDHDRLCVSILDNGEGLDPAMVDRVFEPFFTTKNPGSGYGLGLAVCQRIIDENGGTITVTSNPGEGACFSVSLPCRHEESS